MSDHDRHCAEAEAEITRFAEAARRADPATPVPSCPGWTMIDLIRHHGTTHRWITKIARTLPKERISQTDLDLGLPADHTGYPAWLAAGAETLLATLRADDGDTPVWAFGPDQHVRFWSRRILHESLIHRVDAELALGETPRMAPEIAADGVEEFLTNIPPLPRVAKRLRAFGRPGATLHLHATDHDGEWMITLGSDDLTWKRGHAKGDVAVRGTVGDLLLFVYGRCRPDDERFTVFGDRELLTGWLAAVVF